VGLGPFGGVLALGIGSVGFMGKVYAESIEAIDPQQVKAIQATGANRLQTIFYAVFPQALPMVTSYSLLLFETNVRSATILGLVGAGGVGFTITKYMALFQYDKLLGALIFIVLMVTVVDRFSDWARSKLI
jgi:phosphonate transport system permease protein